jgi:hypothetical protein
LPRPRDPPPDALGALLFIPPPRDIPLPREEGALYDRECDDEPFMLGADEDPRPTPWRDPPRVFGATARDL